MKRDIVSNVIRVLMLIMVVLEAFMIRGLRYQNGSLKSDNTRLGNLLAREVAAQTTVLSEDNRVLKQVQGHEPSSTTHDRLETRFQQSVLTRAAIVERVSTDGLKELTNNE